MYILWLVCLLLEVDSRLALVCPSRRRSPFLVPLFCSERKLSAVLNLRIVLSRDSVSLSEHRHFSTICTVDVKPSGQEHLHLSRLVTSSSSAGVTVLHGGFVLPAFCRPVSPRRAGCPVGLLHERAANAKCRANTRRDWRQPLGLHSLLSRASCVTVRGGGLTNASVLRTVVRHSL